MIPNGAQRIFAVFEKQAEHRLLLEKTAVQGEGRRANMGVIAGFAIGVLGLILSTIVILEGHDLAGFGLAGLDIGGMVTTFVYGTNVRRDERLRKAELMSRNTPRR